MNTQTRVTSISTFEARTTLEIPLASSTVPAGFPSPAENYIDKTLDLNEFLVPHPAATFFVRVEGTSMVDAGILPGDILIVDRSLEPEHGNIVIAVLDGEFTVKRLEKTKDRCVLAAENKNFPPIEISGDMLLEIWGVVSYVIHKT